MVVFYCFYINLYNNSK